MAGFNFGQIADIVSNIMDSDYIDIKRDVDGVLEEIYSNILCHIAYKSIDNTDPETVDIKPVIQNLIIHVPIWVDLQNNDFLIAKKIGSDGNIIGIYSGRCGNPVISQGRKKVLMLMSGTEPDIPTPVPTSDTCIIKYFYTCDDVNIKTNSIQEIEIGSTFRVVAPEIRGYVIKSIIVDGIEYDKDNFIIENASEEGYTIKFVYEVSSQSSEYRFLVNGLYTKDDGSLGNGWHEYKKLPIKELNESGDVFTITSENVKIEHEDNGQLLEIKEDALMVLVPSNEFIKVESILSVIDNEVTYQAVKFEPTEEQENAYICNWY